MDICKVYWDDLSYQLNDNNSNYSIQNVEGLPFKITWDNSEHIINNPENYSYQITGNFTWNYTASYRDGRFSWSCYRWFSPPLGQQFSGSYYTTETGFTLNCIPSNEIGLVRVFDSNGIQTFTANFKTTDGIVLTSSSNTKIKIIDNNIIYEYAITNINSVNIVNSIGGNKIIIEGQQFDIVDVDSARKDCTEICPPRTIQCDCNNVRCCYKTVNKGYELVKQINL
jgi:hypothetical protein